MSGTFRLSLPNSTTMALFPGDPLTKRWQRQQDGIGGQGESIYSNFWQLDMSFGTLQAPTETAFFQSRVIAGGLYYATLPHPVTGLMTNFTGVNIARFEFDFGETDYNTWAENPRLLLEVPINATGVF